MGTRDIRHSDGLDQPYLDRLIKLWGVETIEKITHYSRAAIYQWKPSRVHVPEEAALRIHEWAWQLGLTAKNLRPDIEWDLVVGGQARRRVLSSERGPDFTRLCRHEIFKTVGALAIAEAAGRTRQNIYQAVNREEIPIWLALSIEKASNHRYLVEDLRPELPWQALYAFTTERHP